jgi:hypothetical protein
MQSGAIGLARDLAEHLATGAASTWDRASLGRREVRCQHDTRPPDRVRIVERGDDPEFS